VKHLLLRLKSVAIALMALALTASLAFGAQAPESGYAHAGSYKDHNASTDTTDESTDENTDESVDETTDESTDPATDESTDSADNCLTDPTTLTAEELAAMKHGSIVCWAAHQPTPDGYANHGAWVSQWAHLGKNHGNAAAAAGKAKGQSHKPSN
jgi:hypothetical protein